MQAHATQPKPARCADQATKAAIEILPWATETGTDDQGGSITVAVTSSGCRVTTVVAGGNVWLHSLKK
jgi:hypothetical protein